MNFLSMVSWIIRMDKIALENKPTRSYEKDPRN
jgi:hypothetical protein